MKPHATRDHATWSASASDRRWACPGSLGMEQTAPPDKESHAAAWGTACHEIGEAALREGKACLDYLGRVVKTKSFEIEADEEVCETAQEYVGYVRDRTKHYALRDGITTRRALEQRFSLDAIEPPFDAGGVADCVLMSPETNTIEVVDLKGGRGIVVEALGNKQLRTYALGAVFANPGPWETVRVTIVQPRAPHPDGRIRSEEFDLFDLLSWGAELRRAMLRAKDAMAAPETALEPGDHCTFCRALPTCPAVQARTLELAQMHFNVETPAPPPPPETLEMEQLVRILDHADMISGWLNSVRAYAQDKAEAGIEVAAGASRYVLTEKQARRKWVGGDKEAIARLALAAGEDVRDLHAEPKPLSPAQAEKFLGKKRFEEVSTGLVEKKSSGFNLTRADKTTRPAAVPPPHQFFQIEGD